MKIKNGFRAYKYLFQVGLSLIFSFSGNTTPLQSKAAIDSRPNVLFIAVDDLNDWIGCLGGHPDVKTPNLDRLAKRGMLFKKAYCSAPICNPSRVSLLTGIQPSTSGIYHNPQPMKKGLPNAVPIPMHFKNNGYKVMGMGKIFHNLIGEESYWTEYKKLAIDETVFGSQLNTVPKGAVPDWRIAGGSMNIDDDEMRDAQVANWGGAQLSKKHDKPFFLALGFWRPHVHLFAPKKYFDLYDPAQVTMPQVKEDDWDDLPPMGKEIARGINDHENILQNKQWKNAVVAYLANVSFVDAMVGRVLDALDKSDYAQNTIIVLWGDHGWHLGEKKHWQKFSLWEEATHTPLMIVAPGITKPNASTAKPVSLIDIYPTLADLCGLPAKKEWEGLSLKPLLQNPAASWDRPALTSYGQHNHSLRTDHWRYIRYSDGTEELYDHRKDSLEWDNLAGKRRYRKVKREIAQWLPKNNAPNAPDGKGNTQIPFWHHEYKYLENKPVFFKNYNE